MILSMASTNIRSVLRELSHKHSVMAFQPLQFVFQPSDNCRQQSQLLRLNPNHTDSTHLTDTTLYEHLTMKVTGPQSELWSWVTQRVGTLLSLKTRHLSGLGKPRSDRSSVHTSNLYFNILDSRSYMRLSNSHLGTPSRIVHHAFPPINDGIVCDTPTLSEVCLLGTPFLPTTGDTISMPDSRHSDSRPTPQL